MPRLSIPFLLLALAACGAEPTMNLADFDRSCTIGSDCAAVFAAVCGCGCDEVAIRKSEEERYNAERATKYEQCEQLTCGPCPGPQTPVCLDKVCTLK